MNIVEALDKMCKLKTRKEVSDFYNSLPRELQEDTDVINELHRIRAVLLWDSFTIDGFRGGSFFWKTRRK